MANVVGWLPIAVAAAFAVAGGEAVAQDDLRDLVVLENGRELRGRVWQRHDPDELVLVVGTQKQRYPRRSVARVETVRDRIAEFFVLRDRLPDHQRHQSYLVDWAEARGLPHLARLQATDVVLRWPDDEAARAWLGHRQRSDEWLWPLGERFAPLTELERHHAEWGRSWAIEGEHFLLRCNADLRRAVAAAIDLERLYAFWFEAFGPGLGLREVVRDKLLVQVWRDRGEFPAWSSTGLPYFRPRTVVGDVATSATFFRDAVAERPERLFEVVVQHLLYRTLADDPSLATPKDRLVGWAEVGLGQYVEQRFGGRAGFAAAQPWSLPEDAGHLVLTQRVPSLSVLVHRSARQFYVTVADETLYQWAASHLFVGYLLEGPESTALRQRFLDYLVEALRSGKGDSSSALDRRLGRRLETLEQPFRAWVRSVVLRG
jgi:hypothetical protein